jgi:hypothetical protein
MRVSVILGCMLSNRAQAMHTSTHATHTPVLSILLNHMARRSLNPVEEIINSQNTGNLWKQFTSQK